MPEPSFRRASARRLFSITACIAAVAGLSLTAVSANAAEPDTAIPNSKPAWVGHAARVGTPATTATTSVRVYLAPKGGLASLKADAMAVSTPGSATYGHFITPAQYRARYEPSTATVHAVEAYLRSAGLRVTGVEASNRYISLTGDVAAAQKAFHTTIARFTHNGKTVQAPTGALSLPGSISSLVSTVTGLDTTPRLVKPTAGTPVPPGAGFRNARPCSTDYGQIAAKYKANFRTPLPTFWGKTLPYAVCGYTGPQLRAAYEGNATLDGSGVTVAITDAYASPTIAYDAKRYASEHGDGSYAAGQLTQVTPAANAYTDLDACGASGWFGEETLDVEAVHAMAPAAKIRYYGGTSCNDSDLLTALANVVDDNKASLVSNSWGDIAEAESADSINAYEQVFLQGAMQGISFMFSSGDNGDELANTGIKQVDYPTSDPYVTSVGGTSTAIGAGGVLLGQTGWGTEKYSLSKSGNAWSFVGFSYGAGGGTSTLFNKPAYQDGAVGGGSRQVPDVALDADPTTGMLVGQTQTFSDGVYYDEYRIGGTSLASPLFAGMTALTLQSAHHRAGLLNPKVYRNRSAFTDVAGNPLGAGNVRVDFANSENRKDGLLYSVRTFDQDSSLVVKPGYDNVTGVGVPNTKWLTALK